MQTAFARLHPGVQRWLYEQRWTQLRPIQTQAIERILGGDNDLIVAARTASGKTEAAFLPILSAIADDHGGSVRALYIGPLRALINDQFRRMELLCADLGVPVHRWHGDVGQGDRRALLAEPGGILLTTPESLEAFFVCRSSQLAAVFGRLDYVIIDELHVFPGKERGMHLRSLLHRLEQRRGQPIRRIGLSATLGDLDRYRRWLRPSGVDRVDLINQPSEGAEVRTRCYAYPEALPVGERASEGSEDHGQSAEPPPDDLYRQVFAHHRQGVNLVFANAKRLLERAAGDLRAIAVDAGLPEDRILIHHGSLSRDTREDAERQLQAGGDRICCCSSTLELGVDIGSAKAVAHLGAPWSVASLAQRLGRSGRREGEASTFRQYHSLPRLDELALHDEEYLRPGLVRGIALMQLYLAGWCESAEVDGRHWSTLVHQIMSVVAETGGIAADPLYRRLVGGDGFPPIPPATFASVLRRLGSTRILEQMPDGTLLLGEEGERERADRGFYAAFSVVDEYQVVHDTQRIGSVSVENVYQLGDGFRLGGRGWEVEDVEESRLRIYVRPSTKRNLPVFSGQSGIVHDRVINAMRDCLTASDQIAFLDPLAVTVLAEAREHVRRHALGSARLLAFEKDVVIWPWRGTRVLDTLALVLRGQDLCVDARSLSLRIEGADVGQVREALERAAVNMTEAVVTGISRVPAKLLWKEKFDNQIPEQILVDEMVERRLDVAGAGEVMAAMLNAFPQDHS